MLTVYSKMGCVACEQAKNLLLQKEIEFEVKTVDEDWDAWDFIVSEGHRSFPQIYKGKQLYVQGGFKGLQEMFK